LWNEAETRRDGDAEKKAQGIEHGGKAANKFEIRSTKHETNSKYEYSNVQNNVDEDFKDETL
jgi:hypothetical protein